MYAARFARRHGRAPVRDRGHPEVRRGAPPERARQHVAPRPPLDGPELQSHAHHTVCKSNFRADSSVDLRSGITKKFSGRNALPRGRYRRTAAPEPAALERLRTLERAFHRRVRDDGAKLTTSLCGTYDLPTPQSLVAATTTAQAPVGRRSPTAKRSRSRSRTASPDPPPTLMAPVPSSYGVPALAGPYTGPEPAYAGAWPPAPPAPPSGESIAIAGLLDLAPVPDAAPAASRPASAAPAPAPGPGAGAPFSL